MDKYANRQEAGIVLAKALQKYAHEKDLIVLALPRGGVPVAYEVANALLAPLDVFIVRKLGVPDHEELAMGAIASHDTVVFNESLLQQLQLKPTIIDAVIKKERQELKRREQVYRSNQPLCSLENKSIILVDDGIATGATIRVAIMALRRQKPAKIIVAVPVAARSTCEEISPLVDEVVCPLQPIHFQAVGMWYDDFAQTTDDEVIALLATQ